MYKSGSCPSFLTLAKVQDSVCPSATKDCTVKCKSLSLYKKHILWWSVEDELRSLSLRKEAAL